jgi:hypothetical protein
VIRTPEDYWRQRDGPGVAGVFAYFSGPNPSFYEVMALGLSVFLLASNPSFCEVVGGFLKDISTNPQPVANTCAIV